MLLCFPRQDIMMCLICKTRITTSSAIPILATCFLWPGYINGLAHSHACACRKFSYQQKNGNGWNGVSEIPLTLHHFSPLFTTFHHMGECLRACTGHNLLNTRQRGLFGFSCKRPLRFEPVHFSHFVVDLRERHLEHYCASKSKYATYHHQWCALPTNFKNLISRPIVTLSAYKWCSLAFFRAAIIFDRSMLESNSESLQCLSLIGIQLGSVDHSCWSAQASKAFSGLVQMCTGSRV